MRLPCFPTALLLLVGSLLTALLPARAGTYSWQTTDANGRVTAQSPTYTVGHISFRGGPGPDQDRAYAWSYQGCGVSDGRGLATDISCSGANQATFTWQPDAGKTLATDPPPDQVIVREATYARTIGEGTAASPPTGGCTDGFGGSQNLVVPAGGQSGGVTLSRTRYSTHPGGQTVMLPSCEPTAHSANNSEESEVSYSATLFPLTISFTGTTPDSSGNQTILVGQHCTASLSGIPSGCTVSNYSWSVSGTTLQSWTVVTDSSTQSHTVRVDGPGDLTLANPHWYWNDPSATTETVTCTVIVTPPAGQGAAFPITVKRTVSVQLPSWDAYGTGGRMEVNTGAPGQKGAICLWAGPGVVGGMSFVADCFSSSSLGNGNLALIQLITPSASYVNTTGVGVPGATHPDPASGQGLDGMGAYPWTSVQSGDKYAGNFIPYRTNDSPSLPLTSYMASATVQHHFVDYIMYQPPDSGSGTQWVPLATFTWSLNGNATNPGNWGDYAATYGSDAAGTVNPPNTNLFTPANTFPAWTQVIGPTPLPWPSQSP